MNSESTGRTAAGFLQDGRLLSLSTAARAWNAAFSRGASYEAVPPGRHFSPEKVAGYYMDFRSKTAGEIPSERLLPAALAQLGLGWWERFLEGEPQAENHYLRVCSMLLEQAHDAGGEFRWIYDIAVPKYRLAPPFASGLAQGQIASLMVRAHVATGASKYATAAHRAIAPLLAEHTTDLVTMTDAGPILEEIPTEPRSHVLNGWVSALWGLLDVGLEFEDERATSAFERGCRCLVALLDWYDVGWWTKYSLYPTSLPDLAKPIYHRFQIDQMDVLGRLTGEHAFHSTARRWENYDTLGNRTRMFIQKAQFVSKHSRGTLRLLEPSIIVR